MRKPIFVSLLFACLAPAALHSQCLSASPLISEILYNAEGTDNGFTFVELFGAPGTLLDGLTLDAINGTGGVVYNSLVLAGSIPADGIFLIGDSAGGVTMVPGADLVAEVDYQNGPDSVVLRDGDNIIDAVGYGKFGGDDVFAGEGNSVGESGAGSSIARFDPLVDTGDNSADFVILGEPTPGSVPVNAVPLPASLYLLGAGVLAVAGIGRRHRLVS